MSVLTPPEGCAEPQVFWSPSPAGAWCTTASGRVQTQPVNHSMAQHAVPQSGLQYHPLSLLITSMAASPFFPLRDFQMPYLRAGISFSSLTHPPHLPANSRYPQCEEISNTQLGGLLCGDRAAFFLALNNTLPGASVPCGSPSVSAFSYCMFSFMPM